MPRSSLSVYVSDGEAPKRRILSVADDGYDTGPLFLQAADAIRNARGEFELDLGIDAPDADEESLPGTGFPKEFIACAADVTLRVNVVVRAVSTSDNEQPHCGAYFYIDSDEELDIRQIGSVAGTQPTRVAKKGEQGEYAVYKCNSWGILINGDDPCPETPVAALMERIRQPRMLGRYCREKGLDSHIDVTCYGIPDKPVSFQFDSRFFRFCRDLDVAWVGIDLMI